MKLALEEWRIIKNLHSSVLAKKLYIYKTDLSIVDKGNSSVFGGTAKKW